MEKKPLTNHPSLTHLGPLVKVLAETILGKNRNELIVRVFVVKWE